MPWVGKKVAESARQLQGGGVEQVMGLHAFALSFIYSIIYSESLVDCSQK